MCINMQNDTGSVGISAKSYEKEILTLNLLFLSTFEEADDATSSGNSPLRCDPNVQSSHRSVGSSEYMKTNRSFRTLWGK